MPVDANKRLIQTLNDKVINGGQVDLIDQILSPRFVQYRTAMGQSSRILRPGRGWNENEHTSALETFKAATKSLRNAFPDWYSRIEEQVGEAETVVTRYSVTGTQQGEYLGLPASGKKIKFVETVFARFEDGKVGEFWGLGDELAFLIALGFSVQPTGTEVRS